MAKNILIAGAGYGGLAVAAFLAPKGYNVTILERRKEDSFGENRTDSFDISVLSDVGLPFPPAAQMNHCDYMTFINPGKTVQITPRIDKQSQMKIMSRDLYKHLIDNAEKCGAKLVYDTKIVGPEISDNKVIGVVAEKNGKRVKYFADLVIDAAGCDSRVRSKLPKDFGIEREFTQGQKYYAYRAHYERKGKMMPANPFCVYLYHMNRSGIDWLSTKDDYVDVQIGGFEPIKDDEISFVLSDFKFDNPQLGKDIIGRCERFAIPVRRTLSIMVADGYAAIGDSAGMTNPVLGSGVNNSILAGKILAETVAENKDGKFSVGALWNYQRRYYLDIGSEIAILDSVRQFFNDIEGRDIDFLFERKVVTQYELEDISEDNFANVSLWNLFGKAILCSARMPLLIKMVKAIRKGKGLESVSQKIPERYDSKKVQKWANKYMSG